MKKCVVQEESEKKKKKLEWILEIRKKEHFLVWWKRGGSRGVLEVEKDGIRVEKEQMKIGCAKMAENCKANEKGSGRR